MKSGMEVVIAISVLLAVSALSMALVQEHNKVLRLQSRLAQTKQMLEDSLSSESKYKNQIESDIGERRRLSAVLDTCNHQVAALQKVKVIVCNDAGCQEIHWLRIK